MKPSKFMPKPVIAGFLLHTNTSEYRRKVATSRSFIRRVLASYQNPYVAVSGGKDSMAMLHLVVQYKRDVWVRHWDYGEWLIPRWIEKEILQGIDQIAPFSRHSYEKRPGGDKPSARESHIAKSPFFPRLSEAVKRHGWDVCFLGLRSQESQKRRARIAEAKRRTGTWIEPKKSGFTDTAFPIAEWTAKDVWAYIVEHDVPVPSVYEKLARINGGWENARLSTFFDSEFNHFGSKETSGLFLWRDRVVGKPKKRYS